MQTHQARTSATLARFWRVQSHKSRKSIEARQSPKRGRYVQTVTAFSFPLPSPQNCRRLANRVRTAAAKENEIQRPTARP